MYYFINVWGGRIRTYGTQDQNPWILLSAVIMFLTTLKNILILLIVLLRYRENHEKCCKFVVNFSF